MNKDDNLEFDEEIVTRKIPILQTNNKRNDWGILMLFFSAKMPNYCKHSPHIYSQIFDCSQFVWYKIKQPKVDLMAVLLTNLDLIQ